MKDKNEYAYDYSEINQLIEQGKYAEAEQLIRAKKSDKIKNDDLLLLKLTYLEGKYVETIHCGEALLLSGYQNDAEVYFMLGTAYQFLKNYDKSISNLQTATTLNPDNELQPAIHYNLGNAYYEKGEFDKAVALFKRAIELDPKLAEAPYNLGNAYRNKGEYDKAIELYKKVIKINPNHAEAKKNLNLLIKKKTNKT